MPDSPWLTPAERSAWLAFVLASGAVMDGLDRHLQREAGMVHSHFGILQLVAQAPGNEARMSDVATALRFSPSRLSHAVGRLERDGWVRRRPAPEDGRGQIVALTAEGQERIDEIAPGHVREVRARVFDHLDAEQVEQLTAIGRALLEGEDHRSD